MSESSIEWFAKKTHELHFEELIEIFRIRAEVFVVEQQCVYTDPDEFDKDAIHILGKNEGNIVAYARVLAPGSRYSTPSIGRVLTIQTKRGTGLAKELMLNAIEIAINTFGSKEIHISAQCYIRRFYDSLGFTACSEEYLEDGIPHIEMILKC